MSERIEQPGREIPVAGEVDVLVCGGGPAGVCAAAAAARAGARTCLLEMHGCLGGTWTSGLLTWLIDAEGKGGLVAEIMERVGRHTPPHPAGWTRKGYDVEAFKWELERLASECGVLWRYHTAAVDAVVEGRNVAAVITESKSGREAWKAKAIIDCTGDGDVAARAGCGFDWGRPDSGQTQPMSLLAIVGGAPYDAIADVVSGGPPPGNVLAKDRLRELMESAGVSPSYAAPTMFLIRDGLYFFMANHQYGVRGTDAGDVTAATVEARDEIHRLVARMRSLGGPWADLQVMATGEQIGVREGRRIHGDSMVSVEDMLSGARHDDAVCRVHFGIDVHVTDPARGKGLEAENQRPTQPYDIPLRALIAREMDNLLMAGRCISGDFLAHSSYRVTGNAAAMGQAAGVCAALAAGSGRIVRAVPFEEIRPLIPSVG